MFAGQRGGPKLWLNFQLSRKRNVHIYVICVILNEGKNCKILLGFRPLPDLQTTVFGTNLTFLPIPRFARILPNMQKSFPNH